MEPHREYTRTDKTNKATFSTRIHFKIVMLNTKAYFTYVQNDKTSV